MINYILILAVGFLILYVRTVFAEKNNKISTIEKYKCNFGAYPLREMSEQEIDLISHYHKNLHSTTEKKGACEVDDITWNDLNMKELFRSMDCCGSFYGSESLYSILRWQACSDEELKKRDELISSLYENEEDRSNLQYAFGSIGRYVKLPLTDCYNELERFCTDSDKVGVPVVDWISLLAGIAVTAMIFVVPMMGFFAFFFILFINLMTYYRRKKKVSSYIKCFGEILRLLYYTKDFNRYAGNIVLNDYTDKIVSLSKSLADFKRGSYILISARRVTGNLWDIVLDYFRMFLHIDLIKFYSMLNIALSRREDILKLAEMVGMLDAYIAIASYRRRLELEHGYFCKPYFMKENDSSIDIKELYHPLVKDCVENNINTSKSVLLTGTNASGKSTFLRSVAISAILAQSIYTCPAKEYSIGRIKVASSMSLSDDIMSGDSYYIAEIKSLKRIMDYSKECRLLCVIDEVLRGTNTAERVSASAEILKYLSEHTICFAATHDLELATILNDVYDNFHFTEHIDTEKNTIRFDYKLETGMTHSRNAILLLMLMGFNDDIVERAIDRCMKLLNEKTIDMLKKD